MLIDLLESSKAIGLCPMGRQTTLYLITFSVWHLKYCFPQWYFSNVKSQTTSQVVYISSGVSF